jgi:hypothetical protein
MSAGKVIMEADFSDEASFRWKDCSDGVANAGLKFEEIGLSICNI